MSSSAMQRPEEMAEFFNVRVDGYEDHMRELETFDDLYSLVSQPIESTDEAISVLDLGCGTGLELKSLFAKAPRANITGIDMSEKMLQTLKANYKEHAARITVIQGSYLTEPFNMAHFEYAIAVMTMHHFLPPVKLELYKKIKQALRPGGIYIEGDYYVTAEKEAELLDEYHKTMASVDNTRLYHIDIPFTIAHQKELLLAAGFTSVDVIFHEDEQAILVAS